MSTIPRSFLDRVAAEPRARAFSAFVDGAWVDTTWADYEKRARAFGLGLVALGLARADVVAVLGETGADWAVTDVGAVGVGAVTVGIYPTLPPAGIGSMHYVIDHSEARFVVVDTTASLKTKLLPILPRLTRVVSIVVWKCDDQARALDPRVVSLADVMARGEATHAARPSAWRDASLLANLDDLALLVYTSGTTGQPKGAMLTHRNVEALTAAMAALIPYKNGDCQVSFLPMAHVAERCLGHYARIATGVSTHYARSVATLMEDIQTARPTKFGSVPRIFEKVYAGVRAELAKLDAPVRAMVDKALAAAVAAARARRTGEAVSEETRALAAAFDQQVGARVRARFGGRIDRLTCGAAPISVDILELFDACGMPTYEVYGMTESTGLLTSNTPEALRFGTVGKAISGVELRVAEDGEILVRGECIFRGYLKEPAATAECLKDGWLSTGDIGVLDASGFVTITDRKKNILITAGGKNITPSNVETEVKRDALISYCHLHADRRPYPTALICLDPERLAHFAAESALPGKTASELHEHPALAARVQKAVDAANERVARCEQIKRFAILPRELSIEGGELTPTLKVKRREVDKKYAALIEAMYDGD